MKKFSLLFLLFFTFSVQSQMRNQRNLGLPRTQQQQAPEPKFEIEKYLGIVIYDIPKAAKKSSVKLSSEEGKSFSKIITNYNKSIKDISRINSFLLRSTREMVESFQKNALKSGDYSNQPKVMKKMGENLKPISETLKKEDLKLDKTLKKILSEKQYKKWIKYNKKLYKVFPKE